MSGCIFDGVVPTTNAHIFRAAWVRDLDPRVDRYRNVHNRHETGRKFAREWRSKRADFKVNSVCNGCNSGWMNTLDHAAEDLFATAATKGRDVKLLNPVDKFTVARWCVLVGTLFDQGQADPRLGQAFHSALYQGQIADDVGIWLAQVVPDDDGPTAFAYIKDMVSEDEHGDELLPPAYFITFGIGHLVVQVMVPLEAVDPKNPVRRHVTSGRLRQLWPDPITPLLWPPPEAIASSEIDGFAREFQTFEPLGSI